MANRVIGDDEKIYQKSVNKKHLSFQVFFVLAVGNRII